MLANRATKVAQINNADHADTSSNPARAFIVHRRFAFMIMTLVMNAYDG